MLWYNIYESSIKLLYDSPDQVWFRANEKNRVLGGGMLMKILLFSYYFIVSVQFTFVIPNSFIEFSFVALIIIGSHFCEPFLY